MPRSRPEELLLAYLDARERDPSLTFDAFCAQHPTEADKLRDLFLGWQLAHEKQPKSSLAERLKERFGSKADPGISLDAGTESPIDPALLEALKARGPSSSRYRLKGEVAQGGMGIILRVWDEDLRRHLAMKVMLDETESESKRLSRFLEEAQVTGQLDHPGIVPIHELGIDANGRVYFTMKLVKGKTLAQVFEAVKHGDDGWSVTRALSVVLRVCEAMAFAHEKGVIHRDLKPANIMVGRFGETYVMDWGLARVIGKKDTKDIRPRRQDSVSIVHTSRRESTGTTPNSPLLTMDGDLVGTPVYMPPEQAHGDLERIDSRSDVYAVGAILYHLLSGQMPYVEPGTNPAPYTILDRVKAGPPTALHTLVKNAPAELLAICDKAMERDPDRRYASMLDLADDLRAYLERRVVKAYETGAIAEMKKWVHRNKGLATAAAIALITLAAGATLFVRNTSLKAANAEIANKNEQLARKQDEFDLVAARIKLGNAIAIEETLYPPWPHKIEAMEKWLNGEAAELLALKPTLERTLADLQARAVQAPTEDFRSTDSADPSLSRQTGLFLQGALAAVLADLPTFESRVAGLGRRLAWAHRIEALTLQHPNARVTWAAARDAIARADGVVASTMYGEHPIDLQPQMGLVPIGMNPVTKLWEFYDLRSACDIESNQDPGVVAIPVFRQDGSIEVDDATGVIFVLIPAGTFVQGAQALDPTKPNYDPDAVGDEAPQAVELASYFIARHELTLGQWSRLSDIRTFTISISVGEDSPNLNDDCIYLNSPTRETSWVQFDLWLRRNGLQLPTEAQWERAARGGRDSIWWTGNDWESLFGAANIEPQILSAVTGKLTDWDGYPYWSPVGTFAPNPFGLFDVHGNVWEWCADIYQTPYSTPRVGDGLRNTLSTYEVNSEERVMRGGCYFGDASGARCAFRSKSPPASASSLTGVRPTRSLN